MRIATATSQHVRGRQRGSALLVGLLLLMIATIMTVFAVNIGVFEQRASGNEFRSKQAFNAAEAGIGAATEFIKANQRAMFWDGGNWVEGGRFSQCTGSETAPDPCALAAPGMLDLPGPLFKYQFGGTNFLPLPAALDLPSQREFNVMALVCLLNTEGASPECEPDQSEADDVLVQLISIGSSDTAANENVFTGTAAVSVSIAPYRILNADVGAPIITSNTFTAGGSYHIVANPNGGGDGVPVSTWSRSTSNPVTSGAGATCNQEEFYRTPASGQSPTLVATNDSDVYTCSNCECPVTGNSTDDEQWLELTAGAIEGDDIVFNDPNFPRDLFEYVFGVPYTNWESVKSAATVVSDCSGLNANSSGLIWVEGACSVGGDLGSAAYPVLLIAACGNLRTAANSTHFGLLFVGMQPVRTNPPSEPTQPLDQSGACSGVSANVRFAGGTQIYGAVVSEPSVDFGSGNATAIFNSDVLQNLGNQNRPWGALPGSWSDLVGIEGL